MSPSNRAYSPGDSPSPSERNCTNLSRSTAPGKYHGNAYNRDNILRTIAARVVPAGATCASWHGKAIPEEISPDNRLATYWRNLAGASRRRRMSVRYGYGAAQAI